MSDVITAQTQIASSDFRQKRGSLTDAPHKVPAAADVHPKSSLLQKRPSKVKIEPPIKPSLVEQEALDKEAASKAKEKRSSFQGLAPFPRENTGDKAGDTTQELPAVPLESTEDKCKELGNQSEELKEEQIKEQDKEINADKVKGNMEDKKRLTEKAEPPPAAMVKKPVLGVDNKPKISSGDVKVDVTINPKGAKPKPLTRRKSLNPRVMAPPGLEVLDNKAMVAVRQQMDMDLKGGCGAPNTYRVWDVNDEQLFFATEISNCCCRWLCGPNRKFQLQFFTPAEDEILTFHRTCCRCDCCCCLDCFLCLQKLYVVDCLGRTLGAIKQRFSFLNAKFDIVDHDNNVLFKIRGPCCPCRCCTEISFEIYNKTGDRLIGWIRKKWGGDRTDDVNVDHEYFDVSFPGKLDVVDKALIIGAAFLVNFLYFEMS